MMKPSILFFFLAFILHSKTFGQKDDFQMGVDFFEDKEYAEALEVFEKCYHNGNKSLEIYAFISESTFLLQKYDEACLWLAKMVRQYPDKIDPKYLLFYSQSLGKINRINESQFWFDKFKEVKNQEDKEKLNHFLLNSSYIQVSNFSSLNSLRSEYAPYLLDSKLIFVSNGKGKKRKWKKRKPKLGPFVDIFQLNLKDSLHQNISLFSPSFVSRYNDGPVCFYSGGKKAFLSMNDEQKKFSKHKNESPYSAIKINMVKLYESTFDSEAGKWTEPVLSKVNVANSSTGHATVSPSGNKLLFSSDRKGGEGKSDIYLAEYTADGWTNIQSVGKKINTAQSEVFPYFLSDSTFLFSSDRNDGFGGLDIYMALLNENEVRTIRQLGEPINSEADDFAPFFTNQFSVGYISSNRKGGKGADDIYKVFYNTPDSIYIEGVAFNTESGTPYEELTIYFEYDEENFFTVKSDPAGRFGIWLSTEIDYLIRIQDINFTEFSAKLQLKEYFNGELLYVPLQNNKSKVSGVVRAKENALPLNGAKVSLMSISDQSEKDVELTNDKGRYEFNLQPNQKYKITVYKEDYLAASLPLSTIGDFQSYNEHTLDFSLEAFEPGYIIRFDNIRFSSENFEVINSDYPEIDEMISILKENPQLKVEIGVHSDSRGDQFENLKNTYSQARSLVKLLINKGGINIGRIIAKGYGESKLLNECSDQSICTETEHQLNRRVEFKILDY